MLPRLFLFWHDSCKYPGVQVNPRGIVMLMTIFTVLVILWLLGMVSAYTMGGFIHLLLVLAIAVVLIRIIQGRRPV